MSTLKNIFGLFLLLTCSVAVAEEPLVCPNANATVSGMNTADFVMVCEAVADTAKLMSSLGFNTSAHLEIEILDDASRSLHPIPIIGLFNAKVRRVEIVDYATHLAGTRLGRPFGLPPSRELHYSFIVHEVSHAYTHENTRFTRLSTVAHEYIAYVVQFSMMPAELRESILDRIDVPAFTCDEEISEVYLNLNPSYFAVKSWRHFIKLENGKAYINAILNGEHLCDE
ncbi:hypothetical protein BOW35_10430 [Solemya velum gill symbiont]|uniref:DUF6639 family protein n=1 Tax=Solemya velum gill symbiont TaxID=2340 RepID=UPI00099821E5|nr:DUF6639 family protein [Solemya velum gill symbiont]OOZ13455.1 hypothetical protein BOW27_09430 [Solemya velum gill symbiont]OOZ18573.1 hypothetical protein BOW29_09345 [Solemya velum gill symbiont]OOZ21343.1 hypothetical protein BOW30_09935 [Solemya velum gill symbiont]OOZ22201.1 hypothetical protein BOW31_11640 [Solemya velum gill symbiont]OOZ27598.1 hypothetical protein BOW33_11250 [Solemya velum gill symbiont]